MQASVSPSVPFATHAGHHHRTYQRAQLPSCTRRSGGFLHKSLFRPEITPGEMTQRARNAYPPTAVGHPTGDREHQVVDATTINCGTRWRIPKAGFCALPTTPPRNRVGQDLSRMVQSDDRLQAHVGIPA